jgi:hypothetical protein
VYGALSKGLPLPSGMQLLSSHTPFSPIAVSASSEIPKELHPASRLQRSSIHVCLRDLPFSIVSPLSGASRLDSVDSMQLFSEILPAEHPVLALSTMIKPGIYQL